MKGNDNISEAELRWNYNWDKMKGNSKLTQIELSDKLFLDETKLKGGIIKGSIITQICEKERRSEWH